MRWAKKQGQGSHCQMPFKQFRGGQSSCSFSLTPSVLHSEIKGNSFQAFQPWGNFHGIMTRSWLAGHVSCCALVALWCIWCFPRLNLVDLHGPMITAGSCCSPSHALHLISWPQDWIGLWAFLEWFACVSLLERCLDKEVVRRKVSSVRELLQLQCLVLTGNSEEQKSSTVINSSLKCFRTFQRA